jgi:hypothetical protein
MTPIAFDVKSNNMEGVILGPEKVTLIIVSNLSLFFASRTSCLRRLAQIGIWNYGWARMNTDKTAMGKRMSHGPENRWPQNLSVAGERNKWILGLKR